MQNFCGKEEGCVEARTQPDLKVLSYVATSMLLGNEKNINSAKHLKAHRFVVF